jgi:hypothetical protein
LKKKKNKFDTEELGAINTLTAAIQFEKKII